MLPSIHEKFVIVPFRPKKPRGQSTKDSHRMLPPRPGTSTRAGSKAAVPSPTHRRCTHRLATMSQHPDDFRQPRRHYPHGGD